MVAEDIKKKNDSIKKMVKEFLQGLCAVIQKGSDTSEGKNISDEEDSKLDISAMRTEGRELANKIFSSANYPTAAKLALSEAYDIMQGTTRISYIYSLPREYYYQKYIEGAAKRQKRYEVMNSVIGSTLDSSLSYQYALSGVATS